jgi:branched-chain amino acid aminotransferase
VDAAVKSLNYLDSILAKMQANAAGAGDAIMLDGDGQVAEATGTNVFCVHNGMLRTPPCTSALPGITRRTVIELAAEQGIPTLIEHFTTGDLYLADEAFLTGTGAGIVPIRAVDGRPLETSPGEVTRLFIDAYRRTWDDSRYSSPLDEHG